MGKNSPIEWTDHTFNPWWGCVKVSRGCINCYAESHANRYHFDVWGTQTARRMFDDQHWQNPIKWNKEAKAKGIKYKVFTGSMCDILEIHPKKKINDQLDKARKKLVETIKITPNLIWLILTKRPNNIYELIGINDPVPNNIMWGTSVEDQMTYNQRAPQLLGRTDTNRFLSIEPMLENIVIDDITHFDWIIVGGESGRHARPLNPTWVRSIKEQCQRYSVPFFFKGWGKWLPISQGYSTNYKSYKQTTVEGITYLSVGKGQSGRLLDHQIYNEFLE